MSNYIGNAPGVGQDQLYVYSPASGATTLSGADLRGISLAYTVGEPFVEVQLNGRVLAPSDYTATTGNTIVLASGSFTAGDVVVVRARSALSLANTYTQAEVTALLAAVEAAKVWKPVPGGDITLSSLTSAFTLALPTGWRKIRGSGLIHPSTVATDNAFCFRVSTNGGSSYLFGASDYVNGYTVYQASTVLGGVAGTGAAQMRVSLGTSAATLGHIFDFELSQGFTGLAPMFKSTAVGHDVNGTTGILRNGYLNTGPFNAMQFFCFTGSMNANSKLALEYCL